MNYRYFFLALLFLNTFIVGIASAQSDPKIVIKLNQDAGKIINAAGKGFKLLHKESGVRDLNTLNNTYHAVSMQRVFRHVPGYEKAHAKYGLDLWYEIDIPAGYKMKSVVQKYMNLPSVEYCEVKREYQLIEPEKERIEIKADIKALSEPTDDPLFIEQWHYKNVGQS